LQENTNAEQDDRVILYVPLKQAGRRMQMLIGKVKNGEERQVQ
jgi:hypothetical protein